MGLFRLNEEGKVEPTPEALLIPVYRYLWNADRSQGKETALNEFAYLYFVADLESPYRRTTLVKDIPAKVAAEIMDNPKFKPNKKLSEAIEFHQRNFGEGKTLKLFLMAENMLDTAIEYISTLDYAELGENMDKLVKYAEKIPNIVELYEKTKKSLAESQPAKGSAKQLQGDREEIKAKPKWKLE